MLARSGPSLHGSARALLKKLEGCLICYWIDRFVRRCVAERHEEPPFVIVPSFYPCQVHISDRRSRPGTGDDENGNFVGAGGLRRCNLCFIPPAGPLSLRVVINYTVFIKLVRVVQAGVQKANRDTFFSDTRRDLLVNPDALRATKNAELSL